MENLDKHITQLYSLSTDKHELDLSALNDDVVMKTGWGPLTGWGANFCTHTLKDISAGRVAFKMNWGAKFFSGIFMVVGISIIIGISIISSVQDNNIAYAFIQFGGVFLFVGVFLYRKWMTPRVFDHNCGYYWKGKEEHNSIDMQGIKEFCRLKDIYAIQLLNKLHIGTARSHKQSTSFYSYELNLVMRDGSRINVVDHGNLSIIRKDATKLSGFLDVPVWDVISR